MAPVSLRPAAAQKSRRRCFDANTNIVLRWCYLKSVTVAIGALRSRPPSREQDVNHNIPKSKQPDDIKSLQQTLSRQKPSRYPDRPIPQLPKLSKLEEPIKAAPRSKKWGVCVFRNAASEGVNEGRCQVSLDQSELAPIKPCPISTTFCFIMPLPNLWFIFYDKGLARCTHTHTHIKVEVCTSLI